MQEVSLNNVMKEIFGYSKCETNYINKWYNMTHQTRDIRPS